MSEPSGATLHDAATAATANTIVNTMGSTTAGHTAPKPSGPDGPQWIATGSGSSGSHESDRIAPPSAASAGSTPPMRTTRRRVLSTRSWSVLIPVPVSPGSVTVRLPDHGGERGRWNLRRARRCNHGLDRRLQPRVVGEVLGHDGPPSSPQLEEPLVAKLLVGAQHGVNVDVERVREVTGGRKPLTGVDIPPDDG